VSQSVPPAQEPRKDGDRRTTALFVMLFLLYMFDYVDRQIITSLFPFLKKDLGLTDTQSGLLVSAVYWSIVAFAFPVSLLIDRWSRRKSIGLMVALWSLATGAAALVRTFPQLFMTRLGVGIGEAGYAPGGTAMISALYPPEKRSRIMGLWNASIPLGSAMGVALGGVIATHWGWKRAFGVVAVPGLVLAALFYFFARDYKTVPLETSAQTGVAPRRLGAADIARDMLATPSLLLTFVAFACNTFVTTAYLTWLPSYFNRYSGLAPGPAGVKAASVMVLSIIGAPLGGVLVDLWARRRRDARPLFAGLSSLLSAGIWLVAFGLLHGTAQYVALMASGIAAVLYVSSAAAITQDVVHPGIWAVSYAICVIVQNLFGSSLGPVFVGAVSDASGLATAMVLVPAASAIGGVLFIVASRYYVRDVDRVAKVTIEMS
jgi:MFS family permease